VKEFIGFQRGMGIGGWLTNYKRFNVLPENRRLPLTVGDFEHFESYITRRDIAYITEAGFDHIRLGFDQIVLEDAPYSYRDRIFEILERFVSWCEDYHLHIVFNLHKAVGNYCDIKEDTELLDDEELQKRFISLWCAIEKRFASRPDIAFELLNEVRDVDPEKWNRLADRTVKALRKLNQSRILIIGSTCWNSPDTLKSLKIWDDDAVVYTFHTYAPFEFTHQRGVLQADPLFYNRSMPWPGDIDRYRDYQSVVHGNPAAYPHYAVMDRQFIVDSLKPAADFIHAHPDTILWCGEFGTIRHADITSRENWMKDVIDVLKTNGIPYSVWNYLSTPNDGNRFSLIDDDRREFLSPRLRDILLGK